MQQELVNFCSRAIPKWWEIVTVFFCVFTGGRFFSRSSMSSFCTPSLELTVTFWKKKKCWQEFHVGRSAWASSFYYCPSVLSQQQQKQQRGNQQVNFFVKVFVSSMRFHIHISFVPLLFFLLQSVNGTVQTIKTTTTPTTTTIVSTVRDEREYRVHPPDSNATQLQSELTQPPKGIGSE